MVGGTKGGRWEQLLAGLIIAEHLICEHANTDILLSNEHFPGLMMVKILGGASEVGSFAVQVQEDDIRLLVDNGLTPSKPPKYPMKPPRIDLAFLSHAHIDHSGMIPWLSMEYGTDVIATEPTITVGSILLQDTVKVSASEGYPVPYEKRDVKAMKRHFQMATFGDEVEIGGIEVGLHPAGHIPGATMFNIKGEKDVLVTADINTQDTRLVYKAEPQKCDVLVMESTYSGRNHPPREETEKEFKDKIQEVIDRGGVAIVPAFAVGRSQEIMMILADSGFDVWLDGMGKAVGREFLPLGKYLASQSELRRAMDKTNMVRHRDERKMALKGEVIITTSGMLDGGPVHEYLKHLKDDKNSAVLLTGFQVENTNGRQLVETGTIQLNGQETTIECEVGFFDFSAHADHDELIKFAEACDPEKVVLAHGDEREALRDDLKDFEVILPIEGDEIDC